ELLRTTSGRDINAEPPLWLISRHRSDPLRWASERWPPMNPFIDRLLREHEGILLVVRSRPVVTATAAIGDDKRLSVITHTGRSCRVGRPGIKVATVRATVATPPCQHRDILWR